MHRRQLLLAAPALAAGVLAACGGKTTASQGLSTPARSTYLVIDESETIGLVFWEGNAWADDIPERPQYIFDSMKVDLLNHSDRYLPYFLDLLAAPNPFWDQVGEVLNVYYGADVPGGPIGWWEARGARRPEDDSHYYLVYKREVISRIQQEMGAFLSWTEPRTISAQEIIWGGVPVDGIPPLEDPSFLTVKQAKSWAFDSDQVIGVSVNGETRCYPRRIIDWHEMVNDTIGGIPVSLAYCTLCNSAILYDGRVGDATYRFGTSGMLHRSNKLMYDRQTRSLWGQYTGEPVWGPLAGKGVRLKALSVVHTTFKEWTATNPGTAVLDIETGHVRDYSPGVAYANYFGASNLMFPVPDQSGPLDPKAVVYTVRGERELVAFPLDALQARHFIEDRLDGSPLVVLVTPDGTGARAYDSPGPVRSYAPSTSTLIDQQGVIWNLTEEALVRPGDGTRRSRLPGHNSFWFALLNQGGSARIWSP